ncbi:MAG: Cell envelope-related transcriptional attenuator, partial [Parcubacteria group bacterium GW2011_GWC2_42_6]
MKLKKIGLILWLIFSVAIVAFLIASQFWPSQASFWQEIKGNQDPASNPAENQLLPNNSQIAGNGQPINFLLLGAPGAGNDAPDLTDTIIIAHLDPSQQKIYLFSLPRDLLVKMPGADYYVKINSLYAYNRNNIGHEFDALRQSAEDLTGLPIDHYIFIDLTVLKNTIDTLGGINVMVEKDIIDTRFPGPNHSYQTFALKAGWRYLDGETALKYARSRHSGAGDFDDAGNAWLLAVGMVEQRAVADPHLVAHEVARLVVA